MNGRLQTMLLRAIDFFFAKWPQPFPGKVRLRRCKIVSHRGEHDNREVIENTMAAFDRVKAAGVWGVEFDIRWTRDLHPVVFHDPDTQRIFGANRRIGEMTLAELSASFPLIPTLADVIERFGKSLHLMVEVKSEPYPDPAYQNRVLGRLFSGLSPSKDYHVISLAPEMLRRIDFVPASTLLPISGLNAGQLSRLSLRENYRGLTGHYLFVTDRLLRRHRRRNQQTGTGFIASENCLFREINRGVTWIFSNDAAVLQRICNGGADP